MATIDPNRNLVAVLSYLLGFVTGIVILLVEKEDRFIRFHAMQSTVLFGGLFVVNILVDIIFGELPLLSLLATLINTLILIVGVVVWLVSIVKAYQGEMFKWPIAGDFAEKRVK